MVQPVVENNSNLMKQITLENDCLVENILKSLIVSYTIVVPNKITSCSLYLEDNITKQKFVIAIGHSEVFFEQNFDKALGEKYAYEDAIRKAKDEINKHVYLASFLRGVFPC